MPNIKEKEARELIRFTDEDINSLFNADVTVSVGSTELVFRQMAVEALGPFVRDFLSLGVELKKRGVYWDNLYNKVPEVASVLMTRLDLMEGLTGIHRDSFRKLPPRKALEIATAVLNVNLQGKDDLVKNLWSLIGAVSEAAKSLAGQAVIGDGNSEKSSRSSSTEDIAGQK